MSVLRLASAARLAVVVVSVLVDWLRARERDMSVERSRDCERTRRTVLNVDVMVASTVDKDWKMLFSWFMARVRSAVILVAREAVILRMLVARLLSTPLARACSAVMAASNTDCAVETAKASEEEVVRVEERSALALAVMLAVMEVSQ